jgi:hypothetical protein
MSLVTNGLGAGATIERLLLNGLESGEVPATTTGCIAAQQVYQGGLQRGDTYQGGMTTGQAGCCNG